jgi:hypothetical protein
MVAFFAKNAKRFQNLRDQSLMRVAPQAWTSHKTYTGLSPAAAKASPSIKILPFGVTG